MFAHGMIGGLEACFGFRFEFGTAVARRFNQFAKLFADGFGLFPGHSGEKLFGFLHDIFQVTREFFRISCSCIHNDLLSFLFTLTSRFGFVRYAEKPKRNCSSSGLMPSEAQIFFEAIRLAALRTMWSNSFRGNSTPSCLI